MPGQIIDHDVRECMRCTIAQEMRASDRLNKRIELCTCIKHPRVKTRLNGRVYVRQVTGRRTGKMGPEMCMVSETDKTMDSDNIVPPSFQQRENNKLSSSTLASLNNGVARSNEAGITRNVLATKKDYIRKTGK